MYLFQDTLQDTILLKLTRKLAINCFVYPVYSLFNEIKKFFLFFLKSGYKGYKC